MNMHCLCQAALRPYRRLALLLLAASCTAWVLAGCAGTAQRVSPDVLEAHLLDDRPFVQQQFEVPGEAEVFGRSEEMDVFVRDVLLRKTRRDGSFRALVSAMNDAEFLNMRYDAHLTRTAAESFAARSGNCLSLALVASALAERLGLDVEFQRVLVPDIPQFDPTTADRYLQMVGHVNLRLTERVGTRVVQTVTLDFLSPPGVVTPRGVPIDRKRVLALFYNNRAVESLLEGNAQKAYWWVRASLLQDADYAGGYITLGAVWHRMGQQSRAEAAYAAALRVEPDNANAAANLAALRSPAASEGKVALKDVPNGQAWRALTHRQLKSGDLTAARQSLGQMTDTSQAAEKAWLEALALSAEGELERATDALASARRAASDPASKSFLTRKWNLLKEVARRSAPAGP